MTVTFVIPIWSPVTTNEISHNKCYTLMKVLLSELTIIGVLHYTVPRTGLWHIISLEFLRLFLRCHFLGKPVVASWNVSCFLIAPCEGILTSSRRSDSRAPKKNHEEKNNLTRSPLTAALYYLNAWNRLRESKTVELGFQIPIVSGISDPLSCIPDFKAQDSGFHKQNVKYKEKFPGFPYVGRFFGYLLVLFLLC